jgi:hypothetical protein
LPSFRRIRILLLLGVLVLTLGLTQFERFMVREWRVPLAVAVYPVNGDGSAVAADYIRSLSVADFEPISAFVKREAARYGVRSSGVRLMLMPQLHDLPPAPPTAHSVLQIMGWSLHLRWWSYRHSEQLLPQLGLIRLYVLYHEPVPGLPLAHSLGLEKGLLGVVNAFATPRQTAQNNIVIAHEMLHTLGATDKYDADGRPVYPDGYADPDEPQTVRRYQAEIMAGRIALPGGRALMPDSLGQCVIGAATAHEINFDSTY